MSSNFSATAEYQSLRTSKLPATSFRPDIQGLRTIAVMAVVLYHLWPLRLTGGFVGVDVFFVISGYLITGHMSRELTRSQGFSLTMFWARRIRRLLPAAFLVLIASIVAVFFLVPETLWDSSAKQLGASALYLQNWVLASDAVDYSALNEDATVAQHYWSLSIEEQFYVMWPLLMILFLWLATRVFKKLSVAPPSRRGTLIVGLTVLGVCSLAYSIVETATNPSAAYFVTGTRIWEFAVGGLVALVFHDRRLMGTWAIVIAWLGLVAIVLSAVLYSGNTAFPGYTALLPVLGTAAVLACSGNPVFAGPAWCLARKPMTFLGDISYALYLWHWPLIVIAPFALQTPLTTPIKLAILGSSILLAWLTKILVEDPARLGNALKRKMAAYSFAVVGMAVVVGLSFGLVIMTNQQAPLSAEFQSSSCYGPNALNPQNGCNSVLGDEQLPTRQPSLFPNKIRAPCTPVARLEAAEQNRRLAIWECQVPRPRKQLP
ncbi:acyltransferase family protein [Arthrobacter psychrolactophilus]